MIQRIQSVYLFLVFILSVLFITGTLYNFNDPAGKMVVVRFSGSFYENGKTLPDMDIVQLILSVMIPVLAVSAIFLFKKRKIQWWMVMSVSVLDIILVCILVVHLIHGGGAGFSAPVPSYRSIIPAVNLVFLLLSLRGINKDEKLVKSYDRIR